VCEHDVIIGVSKNSLHIWQWRALSRSASAARGVFSQSVESGTSNAESISEVGRGCGCEYRWRVASIDPIEQSMSLASNTHA